MDSMVINDFKSACGNSMNSSKKSHERENRRGHCTPISKRSVKTSARASKTKNRSFVKDDFEIFVPAIK